jgi:hypothetical protein
MSGKGADFAEAVTRSIAAGASGPATFVAMMQATGPGKAVGRGGGGKILVQREIRSAPMTIAKITRQDATRVRVIEDDDLVKTLATIEPMSTIRRMNFATRNGQ